VDKIASPQEWTSVVVFGRYEELTKTSDSRCNSRDPFWTP
jgi:nitroimidazol reductase NimA-like FMN-containing flavoprotein (pyridoxamine 5'-phosphate oxidase superfamily)